MRGNLDEAVKAVVGLQADNWAVGTNNGPGIDTLDFDEALIVLNAGAVGTDGTVDVKVQESADNSSFSDISGAAFTQITADNDEAIYVGRLKLGEKTRERYMRIVATVGTAACDLGVVVLLARAAISPVSQVNTVAFSK